MEESSALEQKGDAVDCCKDSSHVGLQSTKCDAVGNAVSQQDPAALTAVSAITDSSDVMDDAPRTEDNVRWHWCTVLLRVCMCVCVYLHTCV